MNKKKLSSIFLIAILYFNKQFINAQQFVKVGSNISQVTFTNEIIESNLVNIFNYEYLYNGGGVAIGDINNDNLLDVYFISNMGDNKLYLNNGNFYFTDITESSKTKGEAGFSTGVSMIDINQDGLLDIYICKSALSKESFRENELLINNGDLTFTNRAAEYGLNDASYSNQAYFFDMDLDGDLDMYLVNHPIDFKAANTLKVEKNASGEIKFLTGNDLTFYSDKLYRNDNNKFVNISEEAGIRNESFGTSAIISDFNNDNFPDIYVCNDFVKPDFLYINDGKGKFIDSLGHYFNYTSFSTKGSDCADINNDGLLDVFTIDKLPKDLKSYKTHQIDQDAGNFNLMQNYNLGKQISSNTLQLKNHDNSYTEMAKFAGISATDWSWSPLIADFNNDGWKDIFVTSGINRDISNLDAIKMIDDTMKTMSKIGADFKSLLSLYPKSTSDSKIFVNNKNLTFTDVSFDWNVELGKISTGAAYGDLNNDGYIDIVTNNINDQASILMNTGGRDFSNNFIKIKLKDESNKPILGTKVKLYDKMGYFYNTPQIIEVYPNRGFLSCSDQTLHFGLGKKNKIEKIEVFWNDGTYQELYDVEVNQFLEIVKNPAKNIGNARKNKDENLFKDVSFLLPIEMNFIKVKADSIFNEFLIKNLSLEGNGVSVGDFNNDSLDDLFIGGSASERPKLFFQKINGEFYKSEQEFDLNVGNNISSIIFDINNDGFNDLFVVTGGDKNNNLDKSYQDRVYINDGKGNMIYTQNCLPEIFQSGKAISICDIDNDGYMDAFIGGRIDPSNPFQKPKSYLLKNEKGRFLDYTKKWSVGFDTLGMITDAKFADLNLDGIEELIVCGDLMAVEIYEFKKNRFTNATAKYGVNTGVGLWNSIGISDVNNDSIPDLFFGNIGLNNNLINSYYSIFTDKKTKKSFGIFSKKMNDTLFPMNRIEELVQFKGDLTENLLNYSDFSNKSNDALFSGSHLVKNIKLENLKNEVYISKKKNFKFVSLPNEMQISNLNNFTPLQITNKNYILTSGSIISRNNILGNFDGVSAKKIEFYESEGINSLEEVNLGKNISQVFTLNCLKKTKFLVLDNTGKFSLFDEEN
jgi:hypothetical protein